MIVLGLVAFFFIINMILLGSVIIDVFHLDEKGITYASPVGMVAYFGLLQLLYYPIQYLSASSTWIHLFTILLSVIIFLLSLWKRKSIVQHFKKMMNHKVEILVCFILFVILCVFYSNVEFILRTEDSNFYIPYVAENVYTAHIGLNTNVYYRFQGIYNFYSTLIYLFHRLSFLPGYLYMLPLGIVSWCPALIFFWIFPYFLMDISTLVPKLTKCSKQSRLFCVSVCLFTLLMFWYLVHPYYGNTFRRITVVYLMFFMYQYYQHQSWKDSVLVTLTLFSFISQTSTGFFLGAMLVYALIILFCIEKRHHVLYQIALICLPLAMYMVPLRPITLALVLGVYGIVILSGLLKMKERLESFVHVLGKGLLIVLPVAFAIIPMFKSYKGNPLFSSFFREHSFDQVYGYLHFDQQLILVVLNIVSWLSCLCFIMITIKKNHRFHYFGCSCAIVLLTFFNPFVCRFVADNMTKLVYFRIYDVIYNPLTHLLYVLVPLEMIKEEKIKKLALTFGSILFATSGILYGKNHLALYYNKDVNSVYHTTNEGMEVLNTLRQKMYIDDSEREIIVASHIYGTELLADYPIVNVVENRVNDIEALFEKTDDESVFQQIFYRKLHDDPRYETQSIRACELARERNVEYTIVESQYNYQMEDGLGYCGEVLFEQNGYRVYIMRYDWLDNDK